MAVAGVTCRVRDRRKEPSLSKSLCSLTLSYHFDSLGPNWTYVYRGRLGIRLASFGGWMRAGYLLHSAHPGWENERVRRESCWSVLNPRNRDNLVCFELRSSSEVSRTSLILETRWTGVENARWSANKLQTENKTGGWCCARRKRRVVNQLWCSGEWGRVAESNG